MVASDKERPTKSRYGVGALPLLTGREEDLPDGKIKYIREGRQGDMHNSLISRVGQRIWVLRGYRLSSNYAPKGGVRYDGL